MIAVLVVVVLGFALVGGTVFLPLGGVVAWVAIGLCVFVGAQLLLFRAAGLRSRADDAASDESPPEDDENKADWRAWRG
jgi:hypothetical protein